jgi:phosphate acetyltransferase
MADMFAPLVAQLKANPKTIVFTEGNDPRILEAASKLLAEGVLKVVALGEHDPLIIGSISVFFVRKN